MARSKGSRRKVPQTRAPRPPARATPVKPTAGAAARPASPAAQSVKGTPATPVTSTQSGGSTTIQQAVKNNTRQSQAQAMEWFHQLIKGQVDAKGRAKSSARRMPQDAFALKAGLPVIGQMYFFIYDAKLKDELPYWDRFPLVIPVNYYDNGFLGLNLHYLPPMQRAILLDKLMDYKKAYKTPRAFMKVSYALLKSAVKSSLFAPTVHRYLTWHVKTAFVKVESEYWERAARLPVQQFQKASSAQVWKDSAKAVK